MIKHSPLGFRRLLGCAISLARAGLVPALLMGGGAWAQVLINPVIVELSSQQRTATVAISLSKNAPAPILLQTELLQWTQDVHGESMTAPSDDLLVTPPIAELQPGDTQVFRVALRGSRPAPQELAYRLILENIAEPAVVANSDPNVDLKIRMRYDLPIVLAPVAPIVNALRWKPCPVDGSIKATNVVAQDLCVRLLNAGNRRVKVQQLTLSGDNWRQTLPMTEGVNLLAGAEREWHVPLQASQKGALHGIEVSTARGEKLQAEAGEF